MHHEQTVGMKVRRAIRMNVYNTKQLCRNSVRHIADKIMLGMSIMTGWRFPAYFGWRDKWLIMTVGVERDLQRFIAEYVKQGETVLDIGANIGYVARLFCRQVGSFGRVLAFEPEEGNCSALRHNLKRYEQSTVYDCAIGDMNGTAVLYLNSVSGTGNSLVSHSLGTSQITVCCHTLDSFLEQNPEIKPDWVKIDVEGAELQVLRGMRSSVERLPSMRIIMELCPSNLGGDESVARLLRELSGMGFELDVIMPDGSTIPFKGVDTHRDLFACHGYVNLYCRKGPVL